MHQVQHEEGSQRFIKEMGGQLAILKYAMEDATTINFYSTFVPPELRGQGLAEDLVKTALAYAAANNFKIIAACSFVQRFIDRHPEYQSLLKN